MKKNILKVAFVAAIALVSGVNVFNSHKNVALSDVALANVEALSMDERDLCPNGCLPNGDGCYCNGWRETDKGAGPVN